MPRQKTLHLYLSAFAIIIGLAAGAFQAAADSSTPIRVAYAGSMGAVMDQQIGPNFAKAHDAQYQGIGQASYALAHLLDSKQLRADVFVSVTPGPMRIVLKDGLATEAVPVASTQMVLTYDTKGKFAPQFDSVKQGGTVWYKVLESPGLRFGRTDPATDPQGRNIVFTVMLAQNYYHVPDLVQKILGPIQNPSQIFTEPSLLTRLESGQLDASIGYLSAVKSQHLPFIELPREINLADPAMTDSWYSKVNFTINGPQGKPIVAKPEPLVFYAAALANAEHPQLAAQFVEFIAGADGQQLLQGSGYDAPAGDKLK
jgi:molybdate/tungstate transport system substrate-binding protein